MQGKIIKGIAGFYYVYAEETDTIYECKAKGIFRNRKVKPLVGDLVAIEVLDEEQAKGNITEILPRKNELIRPASANVDQAMVIFAAANPEPNFHLLDRFLVMMDYQNVPTVICFNKEDLIGADEKERLREIYAGAGGQKFIPESLDKIRRIKKLLDENRLHADIEVDGGINTDNVRAALDAGANIIVAGSAVFKGDAAENVKKFKELM